MVRFLYLCRGGNCSPNINSGKSNNFTQQGNESCIYLCDTYVFTDPLHLHMNIFLLTNNSANHFVVNMKLRKWFKKEIVSYSNTVQNEIKVNLHLFPYSGSGKMCFVKHCCWFMSTFRNAFVRTAIVLKFANLPCRVRKDELSS